MSSQPAARTLKRAQRLPEILAADAVEGEVYAEVGVVDLLTVVLGHYDGRHVDTHYTELKTKTKVFDVKQANSLLCVFSNLYVIRNPLTQITFISYSSKTFCFRVAFIAQQKD